MKEPAIPPTFFTRKFLHPHKQEPKNPTHETPKEKSFRIPNPLGKNNTNNNNNNNNTTTNNNITKLLFQQIKP